MTSPHLKLRVRWNAAEHDGRLTASVSSGVFTGGGAAWIEPEWLTQFADALGAFPIAVERPAVLAAGGWRDGRLIEDGDFVRITILPLTASGHLLAQIGLGEAVFGPNRREDARLCQTVRVAFPVSYQAIADFAGALRQLAAGSIQEISLHAAVP
jgi:hypothetical protein